MKTLIITTITILLICGALVFNSFQEKMEYKRISEEIYELHINYIPHADLDLTFLKDCSSSEDSWVRANYTGLLKTIGVKCRDEDLPFVMSELERLKQDEASEVRDVANRAEVWILELREDYQVSSKHNPTIASPASGVPN